MAIRFFKALLIIAVAGTASCANLVQVKIDVVDQRTALENQVLGTYQEIGGDLKLLASVRSIDPEGRLTPLPPIPDKRREAIRAMQRSEFNRDDIERLKSVGIFGEGRNGYLFMFQTDETKSDPKLAEFAKSMMEQENEDRKVLYKRIVEINENFKEGDLARVEKIMAGVNRDSAKPGEMVQADTGEWAAKGGSRKQ